MKKKYILSLACRLSVLIYYIVFCGTVNADTYYSYASSINDVQIVDSSTEAISANAIENANYGGWSVYRVYFGGGSFGTGFNYNSALIEIDLSIVPSDEEILSASLYIYIFSDFQVYNSDSKLALLTHLSSSGYTGDAYSDYFYISGPYPVVDTVYRFMSGESHSGWRKINVTPQIALNAATDVSWAVFWLTASEWETPTQIIGEVKGISIASADYLNGTYAPYLEIETTSITGLPEISILGNNVEIISGDNTPDKVDHTNFGATLIDSASISREFTIRNTGEDILYLTGNPVVDIEGIDSLDFQLIVEPESSIAPGSESKFQIIFEPNEQPGEYLAKVVVRNSDSDENPYEFSVLGIIIEDTNTDTDKDGIIDEFDLDDDNDLIPDDIDNQPLVPITNECNAEHVLIENIQYFYGENWLCETEGSISTHGSVDIPFGAAIIFSSGVVTLNPGFNAKTGSMLVIKSR